MRYVTITVRLLLGLALFSSCAPAHTIVDGPASHDAALELALFTAVVDDLAEHSQATLYVDPRPLAIAPEGRSAQAILAQDTGLTLRPETVAELLPAALIRPDESHLAVVAADEVVRRRSVLRSLGVLEIDAFDRRPCPGYMVPPPPPGAPPLDRSGCPLQHETIVMTTRARPGGADPLRNVERAASKIDDTARTVRVIIRDESPHGRITTVDDYVLRRNSEGSWVVEDRVNVLIVE